MSDTRGVLLIGGDTVLKGEVRNARRVEISGYVEGPVQADAVVVQAGGRLYGDLNASSAEIRGTLQGDIRVKNLIAIKNTGSVTGNVKYGRLAMEDGAELTADVRNVPPTVVGDLDLTVARNGSVRLTKSDLSAVDPDHAGVDLRFQISNAHEGFLSITSEPGTAIDSFTQADIDAGRIQFVHNGGAATRGGFDCVVVDGAGATSGAPKSVKVAIRN